MPCACFMFGLTVQDGAMPLYFAISEGHYEVAKLLVEQHVQQGIGLDLKVKVRH